jgi:hypothetical protein
MSGDRYDAGFEVGMGLRRVVRDSGAQTFVSHQPVFLSADQFSEHNELGTRPCA